MVYHAMSHLSLVFSWYTHLRKACVYTEKGEVTCGYLMVYQEKARITCIYNCMMLWNCTDIVHHLFVAFILAFSWPLTPLVAFKILGEGNKGTGEISIGYTIRKQSFWITQNMRWDLKHGLSSGQFPLWDAPAGNNLYGSCIKVSSSWGAFHYARATGQKPEGLTEENGTTFSNQTRPTKRNVSYHFSFLSQIPYISEIYWREVGQWTSLSKWISKFRSDWSKWTTSRGGPEYFGRTKPKRTFWFDFRLKFLEFLA